jgi:Domain of unknown function (DUF4440)
MFRSAGFACGCVFLLAGAVAPRVSAQTAARSTTVQGSSMLSEKDKSELLATRELAWRAFFAGDRATLDAMLPAEFIGIGWGGGAWRDKASTLASSEEFARAGGKLKTLEFLRTELQVYGDAVIVFSDYKVGLLSDGQDVTQAGRATEVFVKRNGKWLHPSWHLDSGN